MHISRLRCPPNTQHNNIKTYVNGILEHWEDVITSQGEKKVYIKIKNQDVIRIIRAEVEARKTTQQYHQKSKENESKSRIFDLTKSSMKIKNLFRHAWVSKNLPSTCPFLGSYNI